MFFVFIVVPCLMIAYHAYLLRVAVRLSGAGDLSIAESVTVVVAGGFFTLVAVFAVSCAGMSADAYITYDFMWPFLILTPGLIVWTGIHLWTLNSFMLSLSTKRNPLALLTYTGLSALALASLIGSLALLSLTE